jgi:ABC-type multidrug transport system ATPase subunit
MTMEDDDEGPAAPAAAASPIKGLASASLVSATSLAIGTMGEGKEGKEEEALNEEGASKLMDTAVVDGVNADDENMKDAESDAAASPTKNDIFNEASAVSSSRSASSETEIAGTIIKIINNEDSPAHSASDGTKSNDDDVIAVNNSSATQRKNDIVETAAPVIDSSATQRKNGIVETGALVIDRSAKQRKNDIVETAALVATSVTKPANDNTNLHSKKQDFVLSFEDLTCHVPGISSKCCVSRDNPMTNYLEYYLGIQVQERDPFYSLDSCSGWLKSGEMCLVLGSNDQSKSTLLRALCGRLNTQDELYGTILLDGMPLGHSNQGWRRLSPYVSASDTSHSPVLTVRETFTFAAQCSCTDPAKIEVSVNHLMETLGLMNVADTVVGDENLRGISGGQKRRVTIGEMMLDPESSFLCLENITDGLASTDSYSLIDNIGRACKKYRMAAIISLLQPSDEMVHLFDKLLVLTATGEQAYFGPVDRKVLRSVFLGPDADPSEDNGSICDLVLKHSLHGAFRKEDSIVKTFAESPVGDDLTRKLKNIRTNAPPARERNVDALLPDKKYTTSRWYQFKILCGRRRKLIARNAVTYTRIGIAIFFGIIIGSLFSALDNSIMGSLGRTGYMFLNSFLVLMLSAAVTIPSSFRERVTLFKQRSAEFYSGRVAYLSQVLMDLPLSVLEAVLLSSISYFWVDMNQGANHFFFFMGTLIALECVGQALGRLLCALLRKQVSANAMSSVLILLCGTVAGFMPQYTSITWVLRWLSWITPVSYAFEAMMINEFYGRTLDPLTLGDGDGTRLLSIQGSAWLNNFSLPRVQWASYEGIKIFDIFMILLFALIYDLIGMYYIEHTREW